MEEAILKIREVANFSNIVGVLAFAIFVNYYDSLFGIKVF